MPRNRGWFRIYDRLADNPKWLDLSLAEQGLLVNLWLIASAAEEGGRLPGFTPTLIRRRIAPDEDLAAIETMLKHLQALDLLTVEDDGTFCIPRWLEHQYEYESRIPANRRLKRAQSSQSHGEEDPQALPSDSAGMAQSLRRNAEEDPQSLRSDGVEMANAWRSDGSTSLEVEQSREETREEENLGPGSDRSEAIHPRNTDHSSPHRRANGAALGGSATMPTGDAPPSFNALRADPAGRRTYPEAFETAWAVYPRHTDKGAAYRAWRARVRAGATPADLERAARHYADHCRREGREERFIKHASTFWGPTEPWREYLDPPPDKPTGARARDEPAAWDAIRTWLADYGPKEPEEDDP